MKVMKQAPGPEKGGSSEKSMRRLGFWSALMTALLAAVAFGAGVTTPPRSGPFCSSSCITYPYTNAASFVPRDYLWMYPGILLVGIFVVLAACIHVNVPDDKKVFSQIALCWAAISAALITLDYFIQLFVLQPSLLRGETEGLSLFSQYNPHGIFIAAEDLGYLMMSLAFLFISLAFVKPNGLERAIRWLLLFGSLAAVAALIALSLIYGTNLEYRFEVTVLSINWTMLIAAGVLLSFWFKRAE